jgi:nucleotide-binding universal stress UspA family protein
VEERGLRGTGDLVADSSVAGAIVAAADRHDTGLVVLGSRRPSHLGGLVLGSVGHDVIHQIRRPVLLARHVRPVEALPMSASWVRRRLVRVAGR